jgi:ABC-type uncharacterized transport system involved in gliding motility auxiliary subunit
MKISRHDVFKNLGWLGATLLAAGGVRYLIFELFEKLEKGLLIAGAILLLAGCIGNYRAILNFSTRRGTKLGANTLVLAASVLAILAVANILALRHIKRWDLTEGGIYSLSDQTKKIVTGLKTDVTVMKFAREDDRSLRDQMAEYKALSRHIQYQFVDPQEKPELAKQYGVQRYGEIVITNGARTERANDGSEQEITNALLKLTRDTTKTVCFVEGHGEKATSSNDAEGFSAAESGLKRENYQAKSVNLISSNGVPPDCTALVVAGPTKSFFPPEVEMVKKYLDNGGKAMLMFDPDSDANFRELLKDWNIEVGKNTVVDASGVGRLFGMGPAAPLVAEYGSHPISKTLERTMTFFPMARSVDEIKKEGRSGGVEITDLLNTSPQSWAETELTGSGGRVKFDQGKDTKGPITLGIAAARKFAEKESRLVVIGDSDFASNRYYGEQSNGDLFQNSVNWLARDEDLISIRPKSAKGRRVTLTQTQQNMLYWFGFIVLPAAVFLAGAAVWWKRR